MLALLKFVRRSAKGTAVPLLMALLALLSSTNAMALPAFARQTGQNCVACHAGGQFPELTPYGRMFKMTGYTIGARGIPLSVMGVFTAANVANTNKDADPQQTYAKNGMPIFATGSLFIAGKVTDNIGAFTQITYDNYHGQSVSSTGDPNGRWQGHSSADNMDFRYADQLIEDGRDFIYGLSVNNNVSVSDPWNTAPAWMQYVPPGSPGAYQYGDAATPFPGIGPGGHVAGINAYMFWNKSLYAELGFYRTADQVFSFMNAGTTRDTWTKLAGNNNPYWRFAYSHEWGPHNIMIGTSGMVSHVYTDPSTTADPNNIQRNKDVGVDAQYQYLLDPHTITAQIAYMRNTVDVSNNTFAPGGVPAGVNASNTTNVFRSKLTYVYKSKYGGSLAYFNNSGTSDPGATFAGVNGITYEAFWMPVQYVRVGAQYTTYNKFNGATDNYDGAGRNARDNNTLFFYVWGAY